MGTLHFLAVYQAKKAPFKSSKSLFREIKKMTPDEKWEKVRNYYESIYKDIRGKRIKFPERLSPSIIDMLYDKMTLLSWELERVEPHRIAKIPNVVSVLRSSNFGYIK